MRQHSKFQPIKSQPPRFKASSFASLKFNPFKDRLRAEQQGRVVSKVKAFKVRERQHRNSKILDTKALDTKTLDTKALVSKTQGLNYLSRLLGRLRNPTSRPKPRSNAGNPVRRLDSRSRLRRPRDDHRPQVNVSHN